MNDQLKELFELVFLGIIQRSNLGDSWYIEYNVVGKDEPRYQVLSPMNEEKLLIHIHAYLTNEQDECDNSYNFFDPIPSEIENIKIVDNTR
jgi:hypothetical protein